MQTEFPALLNVFETDYELQYSESYTGAIHQEATIEGYQYCTFLDRAFRSHIRKFQQFCIDNRMYCSYYLFFQRGTKWLKDTVHLRWQRFWNFFFHIKVRIIILSVISTKNFVKYWNAHELFAKTYIEMHANYLRKRIFEMNSLARQSVNSQLLHVNINDAWRVSCGEIHCGPWISIAQTSPDFVCTWKHLLSVCV